MPPLTPKVLAVAVATGFVIVFVAWWMGPSLFGNVAPEGRRVVAATVVEPAECTDPQAVETVRFEGDGGPQEGTLSGCGHDKGERVRIALPDTAGDGAPPQVHLAATAPGATDLRRPVGLGLLVLSSAAGGIYAFLVVRGPRTPVAA